ncbi:MAG: HypC/HybG/HupF family hydrogenase formation chaperone [Gammaproteobacteria bacterium]|nr:HypC/HybG/HupF family hydrogenase formation chaperone [Gammaproteobacteria bacterium]
MCLAIPGQIIAIDDHADPLKRTGQVDFFGISKVVSLGFVPEAKLNDFVIVHAGIALSLIDEEEAKASFQAFSELANRSDFE